MSSKTTSPKTTSPKTTSPIKSLFNLLKSFLKKPIKIGAATVTLGLLILITILAFSVTTYGLAYYRVIPNKYNFLLSKCNACQTYDKNGSCVYNCKGLETCQVNSSTGEQECVNLVKMYNDLVNGKTVIKNGIVKGGIYTDKLLVERYVTDPNNPDPNVSMDFMQILDKQNTDVFSPNIVKMRASGTGTAQQCDMKNKPTVQSQVNDTLLLNQIGYLSPTTKFIQPPIPLNKKLPVPKLLTGNKNTDISSTFKSSNVATQVDDLINAINDLIIGNRTFNNLKYENLSIIQNTSALCGSKGGSSPVEIQFVQTTNNSTSVIKSVTDSTQRNMSALRPWDPGETCLGSSRKNRDFVSQGLSALADPTKNNVITINQTSTSQPVPQSNKNPVKTQPPSINDKFQAIYNKLKDIENGNVVLSNVKCEGLLHVTGYNDHFLRYYNSTITTSKGFNLASEFPNMPQTNLYPSKVLINAYAGLY